MKGRSCLRLCSRTIPSRTIGSFLLVLCLLLGKLSEAQSTTGDITGTVTDSTGTVVSGATVILKNIGTHEMRSVTTLSSGDYTFTLLNPGSYSIQIEASGFSTANIPEVALAAGDRAREDARLQVGSSAQTVQVTAQAPALQTDSSVLTFTVTEKAVQDLPLDGRNYFNLAQITPGANEGPPNGLTSGARPDDRRQSSSISVNGQSDVINDDLVDGLDNNERIIGTVGIRPSIEAIKEINVQSNTSTADVGRTAGGVVNIITKSASNSFHGSICEFFHNDVLDAYLFQFGAHNPKPELQHNQFGGSIGGPIIHDKVFFFGDYEGLRQVLGSNPVISQLPTQDQYNLLRSNPTALAHRTVDPVGLQYALLYPAPNAASTTNGASGSFVSSPTVTRTSDSVDGRVDVQLNHDNLLYERTENPLRGFDKRRACALR
jgi:hypothetical protein